LQHELIMPQPPGNFLTMRKLTHQSLLGRCQFCAIVATRE
jgi:hypothetical protein